MFIILVVRIRLLDQSCEQCLIILYRVNQRIVCFLDSANLRFAGLVDSFFLGWQAYLDSERILGKEKGGS